MKAFLANLLGAENVLTGGPDLDPYREDFTEIPAAEPEAVAFVSTTDQIQLIVREANARGVPLVPMAYGTNIGGLTMATHGGIILDMTRMNRVLDVNVEDMVAVIEPGVTQRILKDHLRSQDMPLTLGYSLAPPDTSVFANALLGGLTNRSLKYGDQSESISGLEVVRADGSLAKLGAWALSDVPYGRVPFPDLAGLFIAWQGTTGIATKMAFQLWPLHPLNERLFVLTYSARGTFEAVRRLCRAEVCDDIGGLSWPSAKMMLGVRHPHPVPAPGEPLFFLYVDLTAETAAEMTAKKAILEAVLDEVRAEGEELEPPLAVADLVKINPALESFAEFPTDLKFLTDHGGGGLTWIGTYGPLSRFTAAAEEGIRIMADHGFPPTIVSRPMRGGHYGVLRFITIFDKHDETEVARVRAANGDVLEMATRRGFVMYKTPEWAWERLAPRMDPGMLRLVREVKQLLDPNGIFNPGKLGLGP